MSDQGRPKDVNVQRVLSNTRTILARLQAEVLADNPDGTNETGAQEVRDAIGAILV